MSKKYKLFIGILAILLISLYFFFNPSNVNFFPECPFHKITGLYCPGCGSQRAIHDLSHLNILEAISHNALMVFTLTFGVGLYLYSKKKFNSLIYHPKSPYIIFGIICVFWILRNLDLFHYLAP
tara:strand:+ start:9816 stop:10187 length:372 start_codon:yes stop_codon:yes gene_type:complete